MGGCNEIFAKILSSCTRYESEFMRKYDKEKRFLGSKCRKFENK